MVGMKTQPPERPFDVREELRASYFPFNEWLPDRAPLGLEGLLDARNTVPLADAFGSLKSLEPFTQAADSKVLGSIWTQTRDGAYHHIIGTSTKLYELVAGVPARWSSIGTSISTVKNWEFVRWGSKLIALAENQQPMIVDLSDQSPEFAELTGAPSRASNGAAIRDFVMLGGFADAHPFRVHWSAIGDPEEWTPNFYNLAGFNELPAVYGKVQRIVPGDVGYVFCERGIFSVTPLEGALNAVFRFALVEPSTGTPAPRSVCWKAGQIFFYAEDGFYAFNGQQVRPIGVGKIDNWFRDHAVRDRIPEMQGLVDVRERSVLWRYHSQESGGCDALLIYNWALDKWSYACDPAIETTLLSEYAPNALSLDEAPFSTVSVDDDDLPPTDSTIYNRGSFSLAAFNSSNQLCLFDAAPLSARFETGEYSAGNKRLFCNSVRPIVSGSSPANMSVSVKHNEYKDEPVRELEVCPVQDDGQASCKEDARGMRFIINVDNGFDTAQGIIPRIRPSGKQGR